MLDFEIGRGLDLDFWGWDDCLWGIAWESFSFNDFFTNFDDLNKVFVRRDWIDFGGFSRVKLSNLKVGRFIEEPVWARSERNFTGLGLEGISDAIVWSDSRVFRSFLWDLFTVWAIKNEFN